MKHFYRATLAASSLLLMGLMVQAQERERVIVIEKEYHQVNRGEEWWKGRLFQRVREDLDHVLAVTPAFSADEYRLVQVKRELNELQTKWMEKQYDQPEIDDVVSAIKLALQSDSLRGPLNIVSPHPVTNEEFTKTLGHVLSRPTALAMPAFAVRLAFGEMADEMLLTSQRVIPKKLSEAGFEFEYPELEGALRKHLA